MVEYPRIILNSGKEESLLRQHPWVFSGAIKKILAEEHPKEGDIVEVYSNKEQFLGLGHFQGGSIAVRLFSFENVQPEASFWEKKVENAFQYRKQLGLTDSKHTNVFRLIYAEGDGLPGFIADYYDGVVVFQMHSAGMYLMREQLAEAVKTVLGKKLKAIYDKSAETLPKNNPFEGQNKYLNGHSTPITVKENDHSFLIDWEHGQKTGFFIDQRENRALLARYSKDKMVCNTFCYTGGFSVYALQAGAKEVHSVDSSAKAIELTNKNIELNNFSANHQSFTEDTFDFLKDKKDKYDLIILDPPAFAKHHQVKHNAIMGYKRLNAEAMRVIRKGGIIFTYSCSGVVDRKLFYNTIMSAAIESKRKVRVMHHMGQPADHPVSIFHPEGEYLKGLVLEVE